MSEGKWDERFEFLRERKDTYYVLCMVDDQDTVVCTGTLMVEKKL